LTLPPVSVGALVGAKFVLLYLAQKLSNTRISGVMSMIIMAIIAGLEVIINIGANIITGGTMSPSVYDIEVW